jgi:hypothetical protein
VSASRPSIVWDGGTGRQVIADPRDNPFPGCPLPAQGRRHSKNGGRLEIGTVGAITSERWAASDWNRSAAHVGIRNSSARRAVSADYGTDEIVATSFPVRVSADNVSLRRDNNHLAPTPRRSIRATYRLFDQNGEIRDAARNCVPNMKSGPGITKLMGPAKWSYYHLHVILEIFSRSVLGGVSPTPRVPPCLSRCSTMRSSNMR